MPDDNDSSNNQVPISSGANSDQTMQDQTSAPSKKDDPLAPTTPPALSATPSVTTTQNTPPQSGQDQTADTMSPAPGSTTFSAGNDSSSDQPTVTSPHTPRKYGGKKVIATIFGVLLLVAGVTAGVFLVQRQQELREKAASGSECNQSPDCVLVDNAGNSGTRTVDRPITRVEITDQDRHEYTPPGMDDGCRNVTISGNTVSWERYGSGPECKDVSNVQIWMSTSSTTPTPTQTQAQSCPSGTELLFSKSGNLDIGDSTALNGNVTSKEDSWKVGSRDGVLMAEDGKKITVTFPQDVYLDTALIYDNDPKSGESPWSINGKSLTTTANNQWAPPFKLDLITSQMVFDNGGDSPHFNVCVKEHTIPTGTPTPTPTATPTNQPTATPTPTFTPTPTPTVPPQITAQCNEVEAYDTDWNLLSQSDLSLLRPGDTIRFSVGGATNQGSFDKARFSLNSTSLGETTQKRPGSEDYYIDYTIPDSVNSFSIDGELHHTDLGWF